MSKKTKIQKIAEVISNISNPGLLAILIIFMAVYRSEMPHNIAIAWYIAILIFNCVIPGIIYLYFTKKGYVFDDTLSHENVHKERILLFGSFLLVAVLELVIMVVTHEHYQPLLATIVGGIVSIVFASVVSYFWKISMHSAMITYFTMMLVFIFGYQYWPVFLLIPLVWWARLVLHRHTIWQLLGGCGLSIAIVLIIFKFFGLI